MAALDIPPLLSSYYRHFTLTAVSLIETLLFHRDVSSPSFLLRLYQFDRSTPSSNNQSKVLTLDQIFLLSRILSPLLHLLIRHENERLTEHSIRQIPRLPISHRTTDGQEH